MPLSLALNIRREVDDEIGRDLLPQDRKLIPLSMKPMMSSSLRVLNYIAGGLESSTRSGISRMRGSSLFIHASRPVFPVL